MMNNKLLNTIMLTTGVVLIGCGDNRPPEEIVKERALARWEIRKQNKTDGLYDYVSPAKKQLISKAKYEASVGSAIRYTNAKIKKIQCEGTPPEVCHVNIFVTFKTIGTTAIEGGSLLKETWLKEGKNWWFGE